MKRQKNRRKVGKRRNHTENLRVKFSLIFGIMVAAVFLGYLTARFVVGPIIGYDASESPARVAGQTDRSQEDAEASEQETDGLTDSEGGESKEAGSIAVEEAPEDGYAIQFGAFSTIEAAQQLVEKLETQGITAKIVEEDNVFKVISSVIDTREEALEDLEALSEKEVEDAFIATF